jgi:hypothetical protein
VPVENPPWVDRVLKDNWDAMEAVVGAQMMPTTYAPRAGSKQTSRYEELGTGHYGAVFDTRRPEVALKVTSDPAEARFILAALSLKEWPDGIVHYIDLMRLPVNFRRRPVYAIWREKAYSTGVILPEAVQKPNDPYFRTAKNELGALLYTFLVFAAQVRRRSLRIQGFYDEIKQAESMDVWDEAMRRFDQMFSIYKRGFDRRAFDDTPRMPYRGTMRTAVALSVCQMTAEYMENTYGGVELGRALGYYLDKGILLADVHTFNVGQVRRGEHSYTVITDPGHAVFLTDRFDHLFRRADLTAAMTPSAAILESRGAKRRKGRNPSLLRLMRV